MRTRIALTPAGTAAAQGVSTLLALQTQVQLESARQVRWEVRHSWLLPEELWYGPPLAEMGGNGVN